MLKIIFVGAMVLMFLGCGAKVEFGKLDSGKEYSLSVESDSIIVVGSTTKDKLTLKEGLNIASRKVLDLNQTSFILTGSGVSNLNGFPINTYEDLLRFVKLSETNEKFVTTGGNMGVGRYPIMNSFGNLDIRVLPVGDEYKNSFITIWDANKTFHDTK
jgi:hypothetical protein